uniref:Uncharacterized protein n=1 Tax=Phlebotomus papatasi TaxID=29031 RepID=A0A1B0D2A9_PHLPP
MKIDAEKKVNIYPVKYSISIVSCFRRRGGWSSFRGCDINYTSSRHLTCSLPWAKIRRVHTAAREGNLRDLQSALDRRKFAVAKDEISPNGASPLHVATIFGHTGIVRYLAGRFPETMSALDTHKRTALHYAATIHDNGHFYNLLVHLGANPKAQDEDGNTAEFFLKHDRAEKFLSHKQLLRNFGVQEQLADEMLNDQGPSARVLE